MFRIIVFLSVVAVALSTYDFRPSFQQVVLPAKASQSFSDAKAPPMNVPGKITESVQVVEGQGLPAFVGEGRLPDQVVYLPELTAPPQFGGVVGAQMPYPYPAPAPMPYPAPMAKGGAFVQQPLIQGGNIY